MSPENPVGRIAHTPECQNPQLGWVAGSKKETSKVDASGDGYFGCVNCGGPAMIGKPSQSESNSKTNAGA
jgi:hypothetical protein